jgi:hypothetical protein
MTQDHLAAILEQASAKLDKDGWSNVAEGRLLTLHAAHDGVQLTVPRVEALAVKGGIVRARTVKGEVFVLALDDLCAAATEAGATTPRKAGFI